VQGEDVNATLCLLFSLTMQQQIDVNKANRIFDFMIHSGWIGKA
jgi:hypothetical protein